MKNKIIFAITISLVAIAAIVAGCTNPTTVPTSTPTAVASPTAVPGETTTPISSFGEADNGKIVQLATGTTFNVSLSENPTTGYSWNWTLTPGLELINTSFASNGSMPGAGGVRTWELKTNDSAAQTFNAVYKRPFEPTFGNETTYSLNITAAGATSMMTYTEANDNQTVTVSKGNTIAIVLNENPSTGFQWNTSATSGLNVSDAGYVQGGAPGMVGAGGNHTWEVTATGEGNQTFNGTYKRSWEPTFGNETIYTLKISIV